MDTHFIEATDMIAYGKFIVCRLTLDELDTRTAMPEAQPAANDLLSLLSVPKLLNYAGRRRFNEHSTLVVDLQRGTAAAWPMEGIADHYLHEHLHGLPVCPMYMPLMRWLYKYGNLGMGGGQLDDLPRYLEIDMDGEET